MSAADAIAELPLHGVQLIEASAGTGKTFALITLALRLLIERELPLSRILAVTFTEAATQEVRRRLRERLAIAAALLDSSEETLRAASAEHAVTWEIVQRHLAHGRETAAQLRARLRRAAGHSDVAPVFTIHGFCQRALVEHALLADQPLLPPELLPSDRALRERIAADVWRALAADPQHAQALPLLWPSPQRFAEDLRQLLRADRLLPAAPAEQASPQTRCQAAAEALRAAYSAHAAAAQPALQRAWEAGVFHKRQLSEAHLQALWQELARGCARLDWDSGSALAKVATPALRGLANKGRADEAPASPLFDAIDAWLRAEEEFAQWRAARQAAVLAQALEAARRRLQAFKRAQRLRTFDDLIDDLDAALGGDNGAALAARLREQYAAALVDEFQDTDPRQWRIFSRVFAENDPALFLIGDPKQAIYGFRGGDVQTYLRAAGAAEQTAGLRHNFRSQPALLRALAALYARAGAQAFGEDGIGFHPVHSGGARSDAHFLRDGAPAPGLHVCLLPDTPDGKPLSAGESSRRAAQACAAAIHALLRDAQEGRALIDGAAVAPGDIAVLVRTHGQAVRIRDALAQAGIAAVAAGKQSLFDSDEAREALALLESADAPGDEPRLRAALATALLGYDAHAIARMDHDAQWRAERLHEALRWQLQWRRGGAFALLAAVSAQNAARLLELADGERRLTNLLQLAEWLQQADAQGRGSRGLIDWLRQRIAAADPDDDAQQLRLESDARRVQIVTVHKSKGLEYPLVFLPFVGIGRKRGTQTHLHLLSDGHTRSAHWRVDKAAPEWQSADALAQRRQREEEARLLYVGLTRAMHALWLCAGPLYNSGDTPLAAMLADVQTLQSHGELQPGDVSIGVCDAPAALPPLIAHSEAAAAAARTRLHVRRSDWWMHSFTQWAQSDANAEGEDAGAAGPVAVVSEAPADDEAADPADDALLHDAATADDDPRFRGSRFGNALHAALERVDFGAWQSDVASASAAHAPLLLTALREQGYAQADEDDGVALLSALIANTLTAPLPEGLRLCELPPPQRRAEMEFYFSLHTHPVTELLDVLHAHGVAVARHGFGTRRRLQGLLTGKIDLVYQHAGQWFLADYKSNRLPGYGAEALAQAMAASEYDLQGTLYALALHRWLRFRLGEGYDYARDFGGVRYLFARGMRQGQGVHAWKPNDALLHALDALFGGDGT